MTSQRVFKDVTRDEALAAVPVDDFLSELDGFIAAHDPYRVNQVIPAIGEGRASLDVVKRYAKELYYLGRWMTPEFAGLIANAPDTDALTLDASEHYAHWAQNFADESGYLGDPNHVSMKVEHCRQLGIADEDLLAYVPMPETVGSVFTLLYYMRGSYEEGLAAFGYARERVAGMSGYAATLYNGLSKHYGMAVKNYSVHAYAEGEHGDKAYELLRKVATTPYVQQKVRLAVRNTILTNEARSHALNRWLEEPRALG
jgi:pyrroloquinoline quinone (PQQ) biosynthesis protein C